jgi:hypothetical protein
MAKQKSKATDTTAVLEEFLAGRGMVRFSERTMDLAVLCGIAQSTANKAISGRPLGRASATKIHEVLAAHGVEISAPHLCYGVVEA